MNRCGRRASVSSSYKYIKCEKLKNVEQYKFLYIRYTVLQSILVWIVKIYIYYKWTTHILFHPFRLNILVSFILYVKIYTFYLFDKMSKPCDPSFSNVYWCRVRLHPCTTTSKFIRRSRFVKRKISLDEMGLDDLLEGSSITSQKFFHSPHLTNLHISVNARIMNKVSVKRLFLVHL